MDTGEQTEQWATLPRGKPVAGNPRGSLPEPVRRGEQAQLCLLEPESGRYQRSPSSDVSGGFCARNLPLRTFSGGLGARSLNGSLFPQHVYLSLPPATHLVSSLH